ncbi:hypothetical protein K504DRAFT_438186 [Pleomassaria siparia CBS 279.74]|uniref:Apple domain-containing protein n=1 Tax=Pleomassaria siparia CBS 279.74 TaxID=1314801 RepID=A0A6G1K030_9PLEO|nr:hypothetical protein K504DRAFT_438186 [Pleomassaria siparia CBS 279.74]
MARRSLPHALAVHILLLLSSSIGISNSTLITAAPPPNPSINTTAEYNTECKTCPHSLCTNKLWYTYDEGFNVTCWTRGTTIVDDDLWLKSEAGCYVTQYDVVDYEGDYTEVLPYCGRASEAQTITTQDATLKYKSECQICPTLECDVVSYLPEETDVTLTCWTDEGQTIIDDAHWLKTTQNCYIALKPLVSSPDLTSLQNCGPIPFLETLFHSNDTTTTQDPDPDHDNVAAPALPLQINTLTPLLPRSKPTATYLINVTIGTDHAACRSCARETCEVERVYELDTEVWLQCLVAEETGGGGNVTGTTTWWSETSDFCYVRDDDFWESPEGDYYRMPLCEDFESPGDD